MEVSNAHAQQESQTAVCRGFSSAQKQPKQNPSSQNREENGSTTLRNTREKPLLAGYLDQNHTNEGKGKEKKKEQGEEKEEKRKKAMVAHLLFILIVLGEKKLLDGKGPFGDNVFKNPAKYTLLIGPLQLAIHVVQNRPGEQNSHWNKTNKRHT